MCGIFGRLYFKKKRQETELLTDCLNRLSHRGPDDTGIYEDGHIFLGSKRLSIIDLSAAGHMPMANENKRFWIVFNGEIFNYLELRKRLEQNHRFVSHTDTEVVLHLFEEKGPECLNELRGMFAFAIWDTAKQELFLARDHLGKKPLKYYHDGRSLTFASELKAILQDPAIPREVDPVALDEFLTYQYVPSPRTGFKNISKLEPAHYITVKNGCLTKKRYWTPQYIPKYKLTEKELAGIIFDELKTSVKMRLRSDVALGAHLSGGIDSSLVVALMSQELARPVKTFSVGFREKGYNELPYADLVAKQYRTDHHEIIATDESLALLPEMVFSYEEPYADPSLLPTWLLCRETKKEVTVALNGDGGDENFAGYQRYFRYRLLSFLRLFPLKSLAAQARRFMPADTKTKITRLLSEADTASDELYPRLFGYFGAQEKKIFYTFSFTHGLAGHSPYQFLERYLSDKRLNIIDALLSTDLQTYLPEDLLVKVDIAGMTHALEVRSPFLDHVFVEKAARLPVAMKMQGGSGKYLLKKIAGSFLPQACLARKKQGFGVPLEYWLAGNRAKNMLFEMESHPILTRYIRKDALAALLNKIRDGDTVLSKEDSAHLWLLLCLKTWLDVWFSP